MKKIFFTLAAACMAMIAAYAQPGTLNKKFGHNGVVDTRLGGDGKTYFASTSKSFLQSDGSTLTVVSLSFLVTINRRLPDGAIDSTYGKNGFSDIVEMINPAAALQSDGKIVIVGATTSSNSDFIVARFTQAGRLDKSFGNQGVTITDAGSETDALTSVIIRANGKIIAGGQTSRNENNQFALIQYTKDGTVDTGFGNEGLVVTNFGNACNINSIALQADHKIVAVGNYNNGFSTEFAIARYLKNGTLDSSFNGTGEVTSSFGNSDNAVSTAIDSNGRIVVGGYYTDPSYYNHFEISRYNSNGLLDSSFNGSGLARPTFGNNQEYLGAIAVQPNGEIIAGGNSWGNESYAELAYTRLNVNGLVDSSFGVNGQVLDPMGANDYDYVNFLTVAANGQILSGGYTMSNNWAYYTLVRLDPNGGIDSSFASDGNLFGYYPGNSIGYVDAMIQDDGKIVVNGTTSEAAMPYFLARFNKDGSIDPTYGNKGMASTNGYGAVMQTDQKVVQSNYSIVDSTGATGLVVSRYNSDGRPDLTYGSNGVVRGFPGVLTSNSMAIQQDNKVVVAGYFFNDFGAGLALIRYNIDGTPDATFGIGGETTPNFEFYNYPQFVTVGNDGKIIVSEVANNASGQTIIVLARFNSNGSVDSSFAQYGQLTLSPGVVAIPGTIALQADGKILLNYVVSYDYNIYYNYVSRYSPAGVTDSLFGTNGTITVDGSNGILIEPDQKLLVSGNAYDAQNNNDFSISRYNTDGSRDVSFGTDGTTITKFGQGQSIVSGAAISNNQLIAVGGGGDPLGFAILAEYQLGNQVITEATPAVAPTLTKSAGDLMITIAPNPTNSSFAVHLGTGSQMGSVTLQFFNNQGMALQTVPNLYSGQTVYIGGALQPGLYFLKVINGNAAKTFKLVKL